MRSISQEFQYELQQGVLKWVTDTVKDRTNDLILCFRDGYVNVYYKGHSLFKITQNRKGYKLSFNLGHARYSPSIEDARLHLKKILPEIKADNSKDVFFYADQDQQAAHLQILSAYKGYIDDFFAVHNLPEKKRQQELFRAHFDPRGVGDELVFYDMELSLPGTFKASGSPDCLAVKLHNGIVTEIVLVEVKTTAGACTGSHGVPKHYEDFSKILAGSENREFLYASMKESLNHYRSLGMLSAVKDICPPEACKYSICFFFTDEAIKWIKHFDRNNMNSSLFQALNPGKNLQELKNITDFDVSFLPVTMQ